ncbi:hypothetical protein Bca4012_062970 [Brassica carinata]|uniref:Trimethylguanosine synthase n=1 Tax=Brassica carinata TaxID=52824 RepID=A0A8X7SEM0_BRACI|nr:hypothetical protein Bca52824_032666 [Brassica carinata]
MVFDSLNGRINRNELMAGKGGGKTGRSTRARNSDAHVVEENVQELSDRNTSDDLPEHPSERIKGQKRRCPSTGGGVSSKTRARKTVSGNEPAKEVAVKQESAPVRDTIVVSLSLDTESEDMSVVSSKEDVLFLAPPWGGPMYNKVETYTMNMLQPIDGYKLFQIAQSITPNIIMFLPKNVDLAQVEELAWLSSPPLTLEIKENFVGGKLKAITAYFS